MGEIFPSPMEKLAQQPIEEMPQQQPIVDAQGRTSEPICTYHGCDHKYSLHGFGNCKCKHSSNKTLGVYTKYL
jgi:hypothetical protein